MRRFSPVRNPWFLLGLSLIHAKRDSELKCESEQLISFFFFSQFAVASRKKKLNSLFALGVFMSEWFPHNSGEGPLKTGASRDNCYIRKGSYYIPNVKNHDSAAEVSEFP